ncbi:NUDIX hydrolase [Spirillospora sp. NPDC049652]
MNHAANLTVTVPLPKRCDNASVGVVITDPAGRFLMFDRVTFPAGVAPVAGHVFDEHEGYADAARAEVAEELGLTVTGLEATRVGGWRSNRCRRVPGSRGTGHQWQIFTATVTGALAPSVRETRNARWVTANEMQELAHRTTEYAVGLLTTGEFTARPGLEPVWCRWMADLGVIRLSRGALLVLEDLAAAGDPHATGEYAPTVCDVSKPRHRDPVDSWICGELLSSGPCPRHGTRLP